MRDCAGFTRLTGRHVVQDVLHGPAVGEGALSHLTSVAGTLLLSVSPGALVGVEQENQLLLDQLPLLRVSGVGRGSGTAGLAGHPGRGDDGARGESVARHEGTVLVLLHHSALQTGRLDHHLAGAGLLLQLGGISGGKGDRVGVHVHVIARHRHPGVKICLPHSSWLQEGRIIK